ncbi:MAG: hypothetical protein R6U96_03450 [Promethearchaeia archaeon]
MNKKKPKCVVCGMELEYKSSNKQLKCSKCNASYDPEIFEVEEEGNKKKIQFKRIKIVGAVLAAFYLLFILSRLILY